jgi:uncharacterized protein YdeI (YjbR/CyaY-like superfamily)
MSPLDVSRAVSMASDAELDRWLTEHGGSERELIVAIYKKASGKQTVTFEELLATAMCHGWIDTQTKSIDDERYAIRFVPRKPGSNWSAYNRERVRLLIAAGRMTAAGMAVLPLDLGEGDGCRASGSP